ncbi:MAG: phage holin family protein [Aeromonas sp.]
MSWLAIYVFPAITMAAYFLAAVRMVAFRRKGSNRKPLYAVAASLIIGLLLCGVLNILFYRQPVDVTTCAVAILYAIAATRCKGNLAAMLRAGS